MKELKVSTRRGVLLDGVLFRSDIRDIPQSEKKADTVMIAITGIHGNFYSNPFYFNIGDTLNDAGIDFIYAQTNDAYGKIETKNIKTGKTEIIGSWNERFSYTDEDKISQLTWIMLRRRAISISSLRVILWELTRSCTICPAITMSG